MRQSAPEPQRELSRLPREESLALLATVSVGRLAFTRRALPDIVPVNFLLDREDILIRLEPMSSVAQAVRNAVVAFQTDALDPVAREGWSVTVVGRAEVVDQDDADRGPEVWVGGRRNLLVRIDTEYIEGRRLGAQGPGSG